jgi:uncharacterized protein
LHNIDLDGDAITIAQQTAYPWEGTVHITVTPDKPQRFTVAVRIPGWCQQANIQVALPTGSALSAEFNMAAPE